MLELLYQSITFRKEFIIQICCIEYTIMLHYVRQIFTHYILSSIYYINTSYGWLSNNHIQHTTP